MTNLPHDIILTALKSQYSDSPRTNVNHLFNKFSIGTSPELKSKLIRELLDTLEKKGYIDWGISRRLNKSNNFAYDESFKLDFADEKRTCYFYDLVNSKFFVSLKPDGIDYAIDIDRKRVKHRIDFLAIAFAFLTVVLSGISLYKTIISQNKLEQKQQILQTTLQLQDKIVQTTISRLNQLIERNALLNSNCVDTAVLKHSSKQ